MQSFIVLASLVYGPPALTVQKHLSTSTKRIPRASPENRLTLVNLLLLTVSGSNSHVPFLQHDKNCGKQEIKRRDWIGNGRSWNKM